MSARWRSDCRRPLRSAHPVRCLRMLPCVRCWTCNGLLNFTPFEKMRHEGATCKEAMDAVGAQRMCCRRMYISHPWALEPSLLGFASKDYKDEELFLDVRVHVKTERVVSCD